VKKLLALLLLFAVSAGSLDAGSLEDLKAEEAKLEEMHENLSMSMASYNTSCVMVPVTDPQKINRCSTQYGIVTSNQALYDKRLRAHEAALDNYRHQNSSQP